MIVVTYTTGKTEKYTDVKAWRYSDGPGGKLHMTFEDGQLMIPTHQIQSVWVDKK